MRFLSILIICLIFLSCGHNKIRYSKKKHFEVVQRAQPDSSSLSVQNQQLSHGEESTIVETYGSEEEASASDQLYSLESENDNSPHRNNQDTKEQNNRSIEDKVYEDEIYESRTNTQKATRIIGAFLVIVLIITILGSIFSQVYSSIWLVFGIPITFLFLIVWVILLRLSRKELRESKPYKRRRTRVFGILSIVFGVLTILGLVDLLVGTSVFAGLSFFITIIPTIVFILIWWANYSRKKN